MRYLSCLLLCLFVLQSCKQPGAPETPARKIYNKEFHWSIVIPEGFEQVSSSDWAKMQDKGADAVEKTYGAEVDNQARTIFVFKNDQLNYFESNWQPFDTTDGMGYAAACAEVENVIYHTFESQIPGIKIDTSRTEEAIDGLKFQLFRMKIQYPNTRVMNARMYSRLFGTKEFSVNIMYTDSIKGRQMLDAWKKSTFAR